MAVVNRNEIRADLGEVAEAGIHLPEPTTVLSEGASREHDHDDFMNTNMVLRSSKSFAWSLSRWQPRQSGSVSGSRFIT